MIFVSPLGGKRRRLNQEFEEQQMNKQNQKDQPWVWVQGDMRH